ncbi:MAG: hypothetical protein U0354_18680 [Candidatus Sericytochromatia bacterium]
MIKFRLSGLLTVAVLLASCSFLGDITNLSSSNQKLGKNHKTILKTNIPISSDKDIKVESELVNIKFSTEKTENKSTDIEIFREDVPEKNDIKEQAITDVIGIKIDSKSLSSEPIELSIPINLKKIPTERQNIANTYAMFWNGMEWIPIFGSISTKDQTFNTNINLPSNNESIKFFVTSNNNLSYLSSDNFSIKDSAYSKNNEFVVVFPSNEKEIERYRAEEKERVKYLNREDPWCYENNSICIPRDFSVIEKKDAEKYLIEFEKSFNFYVNNGFEKPFLTTLVNREVASKDTYVIYLDSGESFAKRQTYRGIENRHNVLGVYFRTGDTYSGIGNFSHPYLNIYTKNIKSDYYIKQNVSHELFHAVQYNYMKYMEKKEELKSEKLFESWLSSVKWMIESTADAMAGFYINGKPYPSQSHFEKYPYPIQVPLNGLTYQNEQFWVFMQNKYSKDIIKDFFINQKSNSFKSTYEILDIHSPLGNDYLSFIDYLISINSIGKIKNTSIKYKSEEIITLKPLSSEIITFTPILPGIKTEVKEEKIYGNIRSYLIKNNKWLISNPSLKENARISFKFSGLIGNREGVYSEEQFEILDSNLITNAGEKNNSDLIEHFNFDNQITNLNVSVNLKETNKITTKPIKEANIPNSTEIPKEVKPTFSTNNEVLFKQGSKSTVSPDGNKIVYFDNFDMYISNISGTNTKILKPDVRWSKASISPDGKVAFIDEKNNLRGIYTINQDGSDLKRIVADNSIDLTSLSWSPDGKKIAFSKVKNAQSDIFTVDADGNNEQNITNDVHIDIAPSYSPSGEYIAYISQRKIENPTTTKTYNNDIYIMNADGSNKFNLTGTDKKIDIIDRPSEPSWSNDSNLILFSSTTKDSNTSNIYITNFHTLYLTKLTNIGNESSPFMIPFDKKIGYVRAGKIYFSNFSN